MTARFASLALLAMAALASSCGGDTAVGGPADGEIQTTLDSLQVDLVVRERRSA